MARGGRDAATPRGDDPSTGSNLGRGSAILVARILHQQLPGVKNSLRFEQLTELLSNRHAQHVGSTFSWRLLVPQPPIGLGLTARVYKADARRVMHEERLFLAPHKMADIQQEVAEVGAVSVTAFGVVAVTLMMVTYALERRHPRFVIAFAVGCVLSSAYGFLSGAWPFGVVELIWAGVAARRYATVRLLQTPA